MGRTIVEAVSGEIRLRQAREGREHSIRFAVGDVDMIIAWIRSAKAELQRAKIVEDAQVVTRP
jgi:hypothetical protein